MAQKSAPIGTNPNVESQVAGTRFNDVLNANPYYNLPRQRTFWDKVLNFLGMRSGYDKAQEQYNLASAEYQAQVSQLASEEEYNSPLEQAQRMRQAGLNPDLTGVSGEPASEFDNQQQSPEVSAESDFVDQISNLRTSFGGVISNILGSLGTASTILDNLGSFGLKVQDIMSGGTRRAGEIIDLIDKMTGSLLDYDEPDMSIDQKVQEHSGLLNSLIPNPWLRKQVIDSLGNYYGSVQNVTNQKKAEAKMEEARFSLNELRGSVFYNRRDDEMQKVFNIASSFNLNAINAFNQFNSRYYQNLSGYSKAQAENKQNSYTAQYYSSLDPNMQAGAENAEAGSRTEIANFTRATMDMRFRLMRSYMNFMNQISDEANKGNFFAKMFSMVLSAKSEGLFPKDNRPSFGRAVLPSLIGGITAGPTGAAIGAASGIADAWMPFGATNGVW